MPQTYTGMSFHYLGSVLAEGRERQHYAAACCVWSPMETVALLVVKTGDLPLVLAFVCGESRPLVSG